VNLSEFSPHDRFIMGVDPGQSIDPTAIAIVRVIEGELPVFQVGHLERCPLGTPYPGIVWRVRELLNHPLFRGRIELVLDETGVGKAVRDLFIDQGADPIAVAITGGVDEVEVEADKYYHVPKLLLVSRLRALLDDGRLRIQPNLAETAALLDELQNFQASTTDSGRWRWGARAGKHDDLVLAVALAVWRGHIGDLSVWYKLGKQTVAAQRRAAMAPVEQVELSPGPDEVVVTLLQRVWVPHLNKSLEPGRQIMSVDDAGRYAQYLA